MNSGLPRISGERSCGGAASIASAVRAENTPPSVVASLAGQLDLRDDQQLLHKSLKEEKEADAELTKLAKSEVNRAALAA